MQIVGLSLLVFASTAWVFYAGYRIGRARERREEDSSSTFIGKRP